MKRLSFSVGVAVLAVGSVVTLLFLSVAIGKFLLYPALYAICQNVLGFEYYDARAFAGIATVLSLVVGVIMFIIAIVQDEDDKKAEPEIKEVVESSNS